MAATATAFALMSDHGECALYGYTKGRKCDYALGVTDSIAFGGGYKKQANGRTMRGECAKATCSGIACTLALFEASVPSGEVIRPVAH